MGLGEVVGVQSNTEIQARMKSLAGCAGQPATSFSSDTLNIPSSDELVPTRFWPNPILLAPSGDGPLVEADEVGFGGGFFGADGFGDLDGAGLVALWRFDADPMAGGAGEFDDLRRGVAA